MVFRFIASLKSTGHRVKNVLNECESQSAALAGRICQRRDEDDPRSWTRGSTRSDRHPAHDGLSRKKIAGCAAVELHYIRVLTQPLGSSALDDVYGILGVDALGQLKSYTFDYRTMRFTTVGE
jgi:hypothetical protein